MNTKESPIKTDKVVEKIDWVDPKLVVENVSETEGGPTFTAPGEGPAYSS